MKIMTQLDIKEEEMADFWSRNINEVNTLISQYRTGAQQQMKLSLYDGNVFLHCLFCILDSFISFNKRGYQFFLEGLMRKLKTFNEFDLQSFFRRRNVSYRHGNIRFFSGIYWKTCGTG